MKRLVIDGYGQIELNQVAFRRDGRIEAQCKLAEGVDFVENGMILAINKAKKEVGMPTENKGLLALNYTAEHMYDERENGFKYFKLEKDSFLPRLGFLATGDRFTTNCLAYNEEVISNEEDLKALIHNYAAVALYGQPCTNGAIELTATEPTGAVKLQVVEETTMPDGQYAVKFVVL